MKKLFIPSLAIFVISQVVMFLLATARLSGSGVEQYFSGYAAHFVAMFITSLLIVFTLKQIQFKAPYFFAVLYCFCAAVAIEFIQLSLSYRTFSYADMFFGVLGAVTFVVISKMAQNAHVHLKA
jgi:VanZ family protein